MKKIFLLLIPAALLLGSCGKKGCTDPNASNYSEEATKDNGDCKYEATITFWFNQSKSISWDQSGVTGLNFYVGDVLIGSGNENVSDYHVTPPSCAEAGTINVTKNLGSQTSKDLTWRVEDQNGSTLTSGTWSAAGGACDVVQVQ